MSARITQEVWVLRADKVGYDLLEPVADANTKVRARCRGCGREAAVFPNTMTKGSGCRVCGHARRGVKRRTPQDEWDRRGARVGLSWLEPVANKETPTPARCDDCGHEWSPYPGNVTRGHGCPECNRGNRGGGRPAAPRDQRDEEAAACGLVYVGEPGPVSSYAAVRCLNPECGHEWRVRVVSVQQGRAGCPMCQAESYRAPREQRDEEAAKVGVRWIDDPTRSRHTPRAVECVECGHRWQAKPGNIQQERGCPECASSGWKDARPGVLYVVVNPDEGRVKIGKTNAPDSRMYIHGLAGFTDLVWMSDEAPGHEVSEAERVALAAIAKRGAEPVKGREYFALAPGLLVADVVEIASRAIGRARAAA